MSAGLVEGCGRRIPGQDGGGESRVEGSHEGGEFWESQVDEAVELSQPVGEVLDQSFMEEDELFQLGGIGVDGGLWGEGLLPGESSDAEGVDGVGLGPGQVFLCEAVGANGIDDGHSVGSVPQEGTQVLAVVSGGLLGDEQPAGLSQQAEQLVVASGVLRKRRRPESHVAIWADDGDEVSLGTDIDSGITHGAGLDLPRDPSLSKRGHLSKMRSSYRPSSLENGQMASISPARTSPPTRSSTTFCPCCEYNRLRSMDGVCRSDTPYSQEAAARPGLR